VRALQRRLIDLGYKLRVDGSFGSTTRRSVRDFQRSHGLQADGIVGNKTWRSLGF